MTVLLTGGSGFIGTKIAEKFISQNIAVANVDRAVLADPSALYAFVKKVDPTYIFHLASYGNMYNQTDINETISTNYLKTHFLLNAVKHHSFKALINFSTSSVYGRKYIRMTESDIIEPETMYAATKAGAEYLCKVYATMYNKPIVNVRPFSVTGVGEQEGHLIPQLINSCLNGERIDFVPKPAHDFIDVYDLVDGVLTCALHADILAGSSINIGSGKQYTNKEVKDIVETVTKKKAKVLKKESMRTYDANMWIADIDRMKSLGWKPKKDLHTSIKEMYEVAKQNTKA